MKKIIDKKKYESNESNEIGWLIEYHDGKLIEWNNKMINFDRLYQFVRSNNFKLRFMEEMETEL